MTDDGVKERFLKMEDVTQNKRAHDLAQAIFTFLDSYDCKTKVVAQCYDGAAVMASGINGVQALIKEVIPYALFVHCYAHTLNLVMSQGAAKIKECKIFFAHLGGMAAFFSRSPKRTKLLDEHCERRLPRVAPTRWNYSGRLVSTVCEEREELLQVFKHITDNPAEFDPDSIHCAVGHSAQLQSFAFCFLLYTFRGIFGFAEVLFGILQNKSLDVQFCLSRIEDFRQNIESERAKFDSVFEETVEAVGEPSARRATRGEDARTYYRELHKTVLDSIVSQMTNRFQDHERLLFLTLLDPQRFTEYKQAFPENALRSLDESYKAQFDLARLRTELRVMYSMSDFQGKSPYDLLNFLQAKGLGESMSQLYGLTCLVSTIPVSTASVERSFSALKRIKTYSRNTTGQSRLSALASISIEKELLLQLKKENRLHEEVIERFIRKERRMDFVYK